VKLAACPQYPASDVPADLLEDVQSILSCAMARVNEAPQSSTRDRKSVQA
jgi:hypothetical protein